MTMSDIALTCLFFILGIVFSAFFLENPLLIVMIGAAIAVWGMLSMQLYEAIKNDKSLDGKSPKRRARIRAAQDAVLAMMAAHLTHQYKHAQSFAIEFGYQNVSLLALGGIEKRVSCAELYENCVDTVITKNRLGFKDRNLLRNVLRSSMFLELPRMSAHETMRHLAAKA